MTHEIAELNKIVSEFIERLAYESQQFERRFNAQIDLIMQHKLKIAAVPIATQVKEIQLPEVGFLRLKQIIGDKKSNPPMPGILPISRTSWYQGIKQGYFPAAVKLGTKSSVWRVEDIRKLLESFPRRL